MDYRKIIVLLLLIFFIAGPVYSFTFEERKEAWLERDGQKLSGGYLYKQSSGQRAADSYNREDDAEWGRPYIFAWLEKGKYFNSTPSQRQYPALRSAHGEIRTLAEGSVGAAASTAGYSILRLLYQSPYKDIISGDICPNGNCYPYPEDLNKLNNSLTGAKHDYGVSSRVFDGGCSTQPTRTIISYLHTLENNSISFYCGSNCPVWWTNPYTGEKMTEGRTYNSYEFTRDALYNYFETCLLKPTNEEMDGAYTDILVNGLLALYDLSGRSLERLNGQPDPEGLEMKKRAKMMLDFMMLELGMDFSTNHYGGKFGRHYQRGSVRGNSSIGEYLYPLLGLGPLLSTGGIDSIAYTTDYRPAEIVREITNISDEPDNYWHLHKENNGVVPNSDFGKWTYVTKYYNLGGGSIGYNGRGAGSGWRLNLASNDNSNSVFPGQPFMLWIDRKAGGGDECPYWGNWFTHCNMGAAQGGGPMYQYKNALFTTIGGDAYLHVVKNSSFDIGEGELDQIYETKEQICSNSQPSGGFYYNVKGEDFSCSYGDLCSDQECEVNYGDSLPRVAFWSGKVNQHTEDGVWKTDSDGISGAGVDKLDYCRKFYPNTLEVKEYKEETISDWKEMGNKGSYTSTKMSYECVQSDKYSSGKNPDLCDIQDRYADDYGECTDNCLECRQLPSNTRFYFKNNYYIDDSWKFFQEDKTAFAVKDNGRAQALETAIIGVDYSSFDDFKEAVLNNAELVGASYFKTSKGDIIKGRDDTAGLINDEPIFNFPFSRMETIYGYGNQEKGKLVEWNNNVMTVKKDGQYCSYDFNNWTYEGNACGEKIISLDFNKDGSIDIRDLGIILSLWNKITIFDLSGDGKIDNKDIEQFLKNFSL